MTVKERFCFVAFVVLLIAVAATAQTTPIITSISPQAVYVGSPATTIIFTGTGPASPLGKSAIRNLQSKMHAPRSHCRAAGTIPQPSHYHKPLSFRTGAKRR
jgi:hypothetical protein